MGSLDDLSGRSVRAYAYGGYPDIDDLFVLQASERDALGAVVGVTASRE